MNKLTPTNLNASHGWLHDIFVWGNLIPAQKALRTGYPYMYNSGAKWAVPHVNTICNAIISRPVDYKKIKDIDTALTELSSFPFMPNLNTTEQSTDATVSRKQKTLASYIANYCHEKNLLWDDSAVSTYEMDEIKQTVLGNALFDFECFLSQNLNKPAQSAQPANNASRAPSQKQPGQPPVNNYKSSGGQSGNIINIVGQPGQKVYSQSKNGKDYCIIADKIGKNTPNAFVKPLDAKAQSNGANIVYMGSGNFYTDCKCWFDDEQAAKDFLAKVQAKFGNKFTNIRIGQTNADSNGYFLVKTEFGECAVKASRLNEEINEEIKEPKQADRFSKVCKFSSNDAEIVESALYRD